MTSVLASHYPGVGITPAFSSRSEWKGLGFSKEWAIIRISILGNGFKWCPSMMDLKWLCSMEILLRGYSVLS